MRKSFLNTLNQNEKEVKGMKKALLTLMVVFAVALMTSPVFAIPSPISYPTLTLFDGTTTVTVQDNGVGDSNPLPGEITFIGSIGSWTSNVTTGISARNNNAMDLSSVNATSSGSGTLTIVLSDAGFTNSGSFSVGVGGTTDGSVLIGGYVASTPLPVPPMPLLSIGPLTGDPAANGAFKGSGAAQSSLTPTDTLNLFATISHKTAGRTSFDASAKVPEPGTLLLLGSGLFGLGLFGRKKISS